MDVHSNKNKFNNPFVSLKHKNFRYYWLSSCISLIGTEMQKFAQPWLAYSLTKSPLLLSLVGILQFTPALLFSLFAGVVIDRIPKKIIIILTQTASMIITLVLAILVWSGHVQYWHILVSAIALGFVNTLDSPAGQSFVIELVGKEDLMSAIALNSSARNVARIVGPALAGLLMGYMGVSSCFFANSVSFASVIISFLFIKPIYNVQEKSNENKKVFEDIKNGLLYIWSNNKLFNILSLMAVICTFAMNFSVLLPVFAKEILHQKESGFGFLMSLMGIGSFIGTMLIATMSKSNLSKIILSIFPLLIGIFIFANGLVNSFILCGICLAISGFLIISLSAVADSILQINSKDEYRGRVVSVYSLVLSGSAPIGYLYAGLFTDKYGAGIGFAACGITILLLIGLLHLCTLKHRNNTI